MTRDCTVGGGGETHATPARIEACMLERVRGDRRLISATVACFLIFCAVTFNSLLGAAELTPEQIEFFETKVRPVLAGNCYSCHGAETATPFANLRVDSRAGVLKGGDSGPAVVPGDSGASRLVQTIRYASALKMPPTGKLAEEKIEALVKWVEMEAPWPNEASPSPAAATKKFDLEARRREHWAWQPIRSTEPPKIKGARHPVDRFLLATLKQNQLRPAAGGGPADFTEEDLLRPDGAAAFSRGHSAIHRRPERGRPPAPGRPSAGLTPLRRALGAPLAGLGSLLRVARQRRGTRTFRRLGAIAITSSAPSTTTFPTIS